MKILAISGSLRKQSFNHALLEAARAFLPADSECIFADIGDIPLYSQDIDGEQKPAAVARFIEQVKSADALIISTPEYNYSIPGGLKNALDWASRPAYQSSLAHKKVAVMSASMSPVGGARVQGHLKQVLLGVLADVYNAPDLLAPSVHQSFAADGALIDQALTQRLERFIKDFVKTLS